MTYKVRLTIDLEVKEGIDTEYGKDFIAGWFASDRINFLDNYVDSLNERLEMIDCYTYDRDTSVEVQLKKGRKAND
jgi:hypothetical protein